MKLVVLALIAQSAVSGSPPGPNLPAVAEFRRGVAAVGDKPTDAIALRTEIQVRSPTQDFRLGAAMAAWRNAIFNIDYDLKHPSGDGSDAGALLSACSDEEIAFNHFQTEKNASRLSLDDMVSAFGPDQGDLVDALRTRSSTKTVQC